MVEERGGRLMRRFAAADPVAVRQLYEAYGRSVFTVAYRGLGDRQLAEEAVQQTFLQAWRAAGRFDPQREVAPWLYSIARRVAVDIYRRERRHRGGEPLEPDMAVVPPSFEATWAAWEIRAAIESLPPVEKEVVRATHFLGLSHQEAAEEFGVPLGTIKSRSHRAHRRLAGMLSHLEEQSA